MRRALPFCGGKPFLGSLLQKVFNAVVGSYLGRLLYVVAVPMLLSVKKLSAPTPTMEKTAAKGFFDT